MTLEMDAPALPGASTRLVALLGWPVRHSLSPAMHNAAFAEQDIDLVYLALPTPHEHLREILVALSAVEAAGANVTVPHKETVLGLCDELTDEARLIGAVNTLSWTPDGLLGDNTDATGLERVLRDDVAIAARASVVVFGTGGAARACAVALGRAFVSASFVGRRPDAAHELAELAATCGASPVQGIDLAAETYVSAAVAEADLVVNATPLGMAGEELPAPFMHLAPSQTALDLVYNPPETPFLSAAKRSGTECHHGLGMLVAQAAASYRQWTGRDAPEATMSAVALAALTRDGRTGG